MLVLPRRYDHLRQELRKAARIGCLVADEFRRDATPARLDEYQNGIRQGIIDIESRIREWRTSEDRRQHLTECVRSKREEGGAVFGEQHRFREAYEVMLVRYRQLLRQVGDALAWTVLWEDARLIRLLYEKRTHFLPAGHGIVGPVSIVMRANQTGLFLVIDNDITRCIGHGDLTVVRANVRSLPLSVEIKTRDPGTPLREGVPLQIHFIAPVIDSPEQHRLHNDFASALGLLDEVSEDAPPLSGRRAKQEQRMLDRAELVMRGVGGARQQIQTNKAHWKSIQNVAHRAMLSESSYDISAPGIAVVAGKQVGGTRAAITYVLERLQTDGFHKDDSWVVTTEDFVTDDLLSAIIAPVALWPIAALVRQDILSGDLFVGAVIREAVWEEAFAAEGITLASDNQGGWTLDSGDTRHHVDAIEVHKLQLGLAFAGIDPRGIAAAVKRDSD